MRVGLVRPMLVAPRAPPPAATAVASQLLGLAVVSSVVIVHEGGHFAAAKLFKMRVDEFSVGMGPALFQKRFKPVEEGGVNYALRALPLGGFVSFPTALGEEELKEQELQEQEAMRALSNGKRQRKARPPEPSPPRIAPEDPALYENKPFLQQALVTCAGVVFNVIFAWFCIFGGAVTMGVAPQPVNIARVLEGSPAEAAGLLAGDKLVSINQRPVDGSMRPGRNAVSSMQSAISSQAPFTVTVERSGRPVSLRVSVPAASSTVGVLLGDPEDVPAKYVPLPLLRAAGHATQSVIRQGADFGAAMGPAIACAIGGGSEEAGLQGPLAIVASAGRIAEENPALLLNFAAAVSLNAAIFNALPIPGLDGFQMLLHCIEAARGEKFRGKVMDIVTVSSALVFFYLFSSVLLSEVGFGHVSLVKFLGAIAKCGAVSLAVLFVYGLKLVFDEEAEEAEKKKEKKLGTREEGKGTIGSLFGARTHTSRKGSEGKPPRKERSGKNDAAGDEGWLKRLIGRLFNGKQSSAQN